MKTSVFIATSLDGFIARPNGAIDWLGDPPQPGGEDYGYQNFMDTVDILVMGRNTYAAVLASHQWPYGAKPVIVLSHHSLKIPESLANVVEVKSCSPRELVRLLSERGATHLYIDGGKTIQTFLNAGLIQRLIITRIPILIGRGLPLFGPLKWDIRLRHIETRVFPDGLEQSEYEVVSSQRPESH